ncbi:SAF domain-containing protein [Microbacterium sp. p3-SID336]|uniref:SAF domain-containing protein n=1 Tax=Microbacterium sp. p3-SID336 TaxID=2916212 RepID=UPI0021A305FD|nr:SAF domain-containing protein [Microbacterium sp. p3-SID336]MCT1479927.1 hypothetical protein [Microbacterium sp. p3-SID336]
MPTLSRSRRAFRGDLRFVVGIVLVIVSIAGVWSVISAADRAAPVLQARRTITQGEVLAAEDFQAVEVGLGAVAGQYVVPGRLKPGSIAARTLTKGELLPRSGVTDEEGNHSTTVVVESTTGIPADVEAGTAVEVWQAPPRDDGRTFDTPRILVGDVVVRSVREPEGMLAESGTEVELVIDRTEVGEVLAAITGGAALSIVPVGARS